MNASARLLIVGPRRFGSTSSPSLAFAASCLPLSRACLGEMVRALPIEDCMVFNITADHTRVRMSAVNESVWALAPQKEKQPPDTRKIVPMSDFVRGGAEAFPDVVGPIYAEINRRYGTRIPVPGAAQNDD